MGSLWLAGGKHDAWDHPGRMVVIVEDARFAMSLPLLH